mgnify:CR=1 FL=1
MADCDIVYTFVQEVSGLPPGSMKAVGHCRTHQMVIDFPNGSSRCQVGRIEDAVEDGLARIAAAVERAKT